jgi:N-acyl-L-homoserine lactone synthetase
VLTLFESENQKVILLQAPEAAPLLSVFLKVAGEKGWNLEGQLSDYPEESRYFALIRAGQVVGGVKLVLGNDQGLPIARVWPEMQLVGRSDVAELALLAFSSDQRGSLDDLWVVTVEMWRYCASHGVREVWAELTPRNVKLYKRLGWPFEAMGQLRDYLGEASLPCRMMVDDAQLVVVERARASERFREVKQQGLRESPSAPATSGDTPPRIQGPE